MTSKDKKIKCQRCKKIIIRDNNNRKYCKECSKIVNKEHSKKYHSNHIKECKERDRQGYLKNKKKRLKQGREWRDNNLEKVKKYDKKYRKNNIEYFKELHRSNNKKKYNTIKEFNIVCRLRNRKRIAIVKYIKTGKITKTSNFMGVKLEYKKIIEVLSPIPKNWRDLHIDEKFPYCKVDWDDKESIKKCFAPENHQWLTAIENIKKGGKG